MYYLLALVALALVIVLALPNDQPVTAFYSPPPRCVPDNSISVPGLDYLFESRYIYGKIVDEELAGYCWIVGDGSTDISQFCWLVDLLDPTASCLEGPAMEGVMVLFFEYRLPVVMKGR